MSKKMITFCDSQNQTHDFPIETPDYGTCATAGDVAEKVVVSENFSLYTGAKVTVKFANANTAGTITLNVNGTGANTVYFPGDGTYATDAGEIIQAGGCYDFVYDDGWRFVGAAGGGSETVENIDIDVENNRLLVGDGAKGFYDQYEPTKNIVVVGNNATASAVSVTIGNNAGSSGTNGVAIGNNSKNTGAEAVAIGDGATSGMYCIAVGKGAEGASSSIAIGRNTTSQDTGVAIGAQAGANSSDSVAIGCDAITNGFGSVAVGSSAKAAQEGVAVGGGAQATANGAIQIGEGTNNTPNTFQVGEYTLLDASGKIPAERLNSGGTVNGFTINEDFNQLFVGAGAGTSQEYYPDLIAIGNDSSAIAYGITIGHNSSGGTSCLCLGNNSSAGGGIVIGHNISSNGAGSIAIGGDTSAAGAIQIGEGENDVAYTFQVGEYQLLDADGYIPTDRLPQIGDLADLKTTSKTSIVAAINELYDLLPRGGDHSGGTGS